MKSYISRQEVREINRKLFAYDMPYSDSEDNMGALSTIVSHIITRYNPEDEVAKLPTIIDVKSNIINKEAVDKITLLKPDAIIVQINSEILAIPEKVVFVRQLKEMGYRIIIELNKDDTVFTLAKILANYIKFDIQNIPVNLANESFTCKKIAYNVNSDQDFVIAEAANIDLYEGTYVGEINPIVIEENQHSHLNFMQIIQLTNNENSSINDIADVIKRDSLMSAQLIRLSNSAYFAGRSRIDSINNAIIRIGISNLKKWIFLMQFSRYQNSPEELLKISYSRALFCEKVIKESKTKEILTSEAYMIGLFSTLDVLTGKPMDHELAKINLSEKVEEALIYREGIGGRLLNLIKAYEDAKWERVDKYIKDFKLSKDKMYNIYFKSIDEVAELWKVMESVNGGLC